MDKEKTEITEVETTVVDTQESNVDNFITQAIASNLPVETLERLFALKKEVIKEQAREAYNIAMSGFQSECPIIEKSSKALNKDGKSVRYKYASIDSIVSQVKPVLGKYKLSYSFVIENKENSVLITCVAMHIKGHSNSSSIEIPIDPEAYMSESQKVASSITFGKRYAFCNVFGITTGDEDTDANEEKEDKTEVYKSKLEKSKNVDELGKAWLSLPTEYKEKLVDVKNKMKESFNKETTVSDTQLDDIAKEIK